jgi:hypothetical protein
MSAFVQKRTNGGAEMKLQFYIDSDDAAERCKESVKFKKPIAIGGADTLTGQIKSYTGVVLSVEQSLAGAQGERWRVAIEPE